MFEYMPMHIAPWGLEIVIYFFLIGTASMVFAVAAAATTFGNVAAPFKSFELTGAIITLVLLLVVAPLLIMDLAQPWRFLNPILYFRWTSPLSWGATFLLLFGLSILGFLYGIYTDHPYIKRVSAVIGSLLALSMPLYTGLDLMVNQARQFWATPALPVLFVVLSITSGAALVALVQLAMGKLGEDNARLLRFILAFSLGVTFFLVLGLVQSMVFGSEEMQQVWGFINSDYSTEFWILGFVVGVVIPLALTVGPMVMPALDFARSPVVVTVAALCGALGAYVLRDVIIHVGQLPQLFF